jgi:hypothetical protein
MQISRIKFATNKLQNVFTLYNNAHMCGIDRFISLIHCAPENCNLDEEKKFKLNKLYEFLTAIYNLLTDLILCDLH